MGQFGHRDTVLNYFCYFDLEKIGVSRRMLYFYVYVGVCLCVCVHNFLSLVKKQAAC